MNKFRATLSKSERLKSTIALNNLFSEGNAVFAYPIKLFYKIIPDTEAECALKFAVSAPKSKFKKAVDRNRIKRKIRESYRHAKVPFLEKHFEKPMTIHLFVIYVGKPDGETMIDKGMRKCLGKLEALIYI